MFIIRHLIYIMRFVKLTYNTFIFSLKFGGDNFVRYSGDSQEMAKRQCKLCPLFVSPLFTLIPKFYEFSLHITWKFTVNAFKFSN